MAALPILWLLLPTRFSIWLAALFFYGAAGPTSYLAIRHYFADWSTLACVLAQLGFLLLLSSPWACLPGRSSSQRTGSRLVGFVLALVLSIAPPIGVISAWHPAYSAGWIWPHGGWLALASVGAAWTWMVWRPSVRTAAAALSALAMLAAATNWHHMDAPNISTGTGAPQEARSRLVAVDLSADVAPNYMAFAMKLQDLARRLREERTRPGDVAVLPENAIDEWKPPVERMVRMQLKRELQVGPILSGATIKSGGKTWGGLVLVNPDGSSVVRRARQPLVLSLWHPWNPVDHYSADWSAPGVLEAGGQRVAFRVCSEEFSLFWTLLDVARDNATALVVVGSHFWSKTPMHDITQGRHGRAAARLFGLDLVRAINHSPTHPKAALLQRR